MNGSQRDVQNEIVELVFKPAWLSHLHYMPVYTGRGPADIHNKTFYMQ